MKIMRIGIDLAKNVFQVHGMQLTNRWRAEGNNRKRSLTP